jgi:hypothetical protein
MIAFQISINGKIALTVGREDMCRLWIQTDVRGKLGSASPVDFPVTARVASIGSENMDRVTQPLHWKQLDFTVGDEVSIRLVETDSCDQPLAPNPKVIA